MPIFYLDYVNGNDANDGSSWALAWKTITSGATAARIAPGDIIRIAKSPSPTSLGVNGTWTDVPTTIPNSKNISASTNASPIKITVSSHGYSTGNVVYIQDHAVNLNANGSWIITYVDANNFTLNGSVGNGVGAGTGNCKEVNWLAVKLASGVTKTVDRCENAWVAGVNCTVTADTSQYKEGDKSCKIVTGAGVVAGQLLAYYTIPSTDFSGYQQISFWIYTSQAIASAGLLQIKLCSDTLGAVPVDTFDILAIPSTNKWLPLTINKGSVLGNAIQSIAIYCTGSFASKTVYFDNFVACKDVTANDSLTLQSLISKNSAVQGGSEGWYGIQSISEDGKVIRLDNYTNTIASAVFTRGQGYSGVTETVLTYKRETIKTALVASYSTYVQEVQEGGASGNLTAFEGGYNTSTNEQDGETFFDGLNGNGSGIVLQSKSYVSLNYLAVFRYSYGIYYYSSANYNLIVTLSNANNNDFGVYYSSCYKDSIITLLNANNNSNSGIYYSSTNGCFLTTLSNANNNGSNGVGYQSSNGNSIITLSHANNNSSYGIYYRFAHNCVISIASEINKGGTAVYFTDSSDNLIKTLSTVGNSYGISNDAGINYLRNAIISESDEFTGSIMGANSRLFSWNHDGQANNHWIFTDGGKMNSQIVTRHTPSGIAWKFVITSTSRKSDYPLKLKIAEVAVNANALVTVKAWIKKDHATNVGAQLVCPGNQLAGVPNDVTVTKTDDINWEELTITFTPTEVGVIEIEAWAYYITGNSNVYVDDFSVTQV